MVSSTAVLTETFSIVMCDYMKKWSFGVVGLAERVTQRGWQSSTVANMKGAKETKDEYYDAMKKTTTGEATLRNMIVLKA